MFPLRKIIVASFAMFMILLVLTISHTSADELRMKNGDRLTGTVVAMESGKLTFKTTYAGKLSIAWDEIARITTDEPLRVRLLDGTTVEGKAEDAEEEDAVVVMPEWSGGMTVLSTADIEAINPEIEPAVRWNGRVNAGGTRMPKSVDSRNSADNS